jgi:hypothetical protein
MVLFILEKFLFNTNLNFVALQLKKLKNTNQAIQDIEKNKKTAQ